MKKGLTYVDVAISIGIFIIYGVFIFIIFKPAIEEEYDDDYLSSIAKNGIIQDTLWNVSTMPIFLEIDPGMSGKTLYFQFPFTWNENSLYMYDELGKVDFSLNGGYIAIPFDEGWLSVGKKEFNLIYTNTEYTGHSHGSYNGDFDAQTYADIGVVDNLHGIQRFTDNTGLFSSLIGKPYNEIKDDWNYPEKKDFFVNINDNWFIGEEPLTEKKINVLTFTNFFLNEKGEKERAIITISTW